jgi:hypothetical protein
MMPSPPPREYSGKQSPPIPVEPASTTHGTAQPAIAASLALPPASGVFTAASVEAECEVAAMPSFDITSYRPGSSKSLMLFALPSVVVQRARLTRAT